MHSVDTSHPDYFHKVVDCQWACPAHTPVPEYIRLIGQGRYSDAYLINWVSNVFPGFWVAPRDRPRGTRLPPGAWKKTTAPSPEPVAICRLKRVAADHKDFEVRSRMPAVAQPNGKRVACVGQARIADGGARPGSVGLRGHGI